jgi:dihydroorotase
MVLRMSWQPAKAFHLPGGTLSEGAPADVTVFDPAAQWTVDSGLFESKSRNTPFQGWELRGANRMTVVGGTVVWEASD